MMRTTIDDECVAAGALHLNPESPVLQSLATRCFAARVTRICTAIHNCEDLFLRRLALNAQSQFTYRPIQGQYSSGLTL
jgi:hypothetical protein